ncbi:hypothetical protein K7X08_026877 [Anisodus acutangulus]|uniref:Uncharacterized protein n=1 Tax=Anisodus acutangulus TaxID=402998 RepID=A0A9Q1L8I6_9SOLA|nr:hypothetical protein K7X08_026877 [Anisodus acutangulus]
MATSNFPLLLLLAFSLLAVSTTTARPCKTLFFTITTFTSYYQIPTTISQNPNPNPISFLHNNPNSIISPRFRTFFFTTTGFNNDAPKFRLSRHSILIRRPDPVLSDPEEGEEMESRSASSSMIPKFGLSSNNRHSILRSDPILTLRSYPVETRSSLASMIRKFGPSSSNRHKNFFRRSDPTRFYLTRPEMVEFYASVKSSIRDRTLDIMRVVGAMIFGVGCGALTAAIMYLMWSLFWPNRFDFEDSDDDEDDYDVSAKKLGYVAIPNKVVDDDLKKHVVVPVKEVV